MRKWNPGLGFGLEKIGLVALGRPALFSLLILAVTAVAAWNLTHLRFEGDITAILPEETEAYRNFFAQKADFRDVSRDVTVLIRSDRLVTASGLEDLRSLQLETAIGDHVSDVVTLFSLPKADPETGRIGNFFPEKIESDEQAKSLVAEVLERFPQARALIAPDEDTAVMVVTLESGFIRGEDLAYGQYTALRDEIAAAKPKDFEVLYTGLTPIGVTVVGALVSDQLKLTSIGMLLGIGIAFYVFRSVVAALICAIPPALTSVWSLGLFGMVGTPITYLSTVLPTLALILAFADGIVLYYRWQHANVQSDDFEGNLAAAIRRVGPASSLTSITTLLAFLSFSFASGSAMKTFSAIGMSVVAIAFLAVIASLPVAGLYATRLGLVRRGTVREPAFRDVGRRFVGMVEPRPILLSIGAIVLVVALSVVHGIVRPEYQILDYLPEQAKTREAELLANKIIGGNSLIFVSVPAAVRDKPFDKANLARLGEVEAAAARVYPPERVYSLRSLTTGLTTDAALQGLAAEFEEAPPTGRGNYLSSDGKQLLVNIRNTSDQRIAETGRSLDRLREQIDRLSYGNDVVITGFDVLMAREFTRLINQLRTSLMIAIFLGVAVIGMACRSLLLAIAALTPNLLPVFSVELIVWLKGGAINISEVIALTIAFGIAVDNAVHMINVYRTEQQNGKPVDQAIRDAMVEVGPALGASTAIICFSALVTQASALPMVPVIGGLMIATLFVAFLSNMAILPANVLSLWRLTRGRREKTEKSPAGAE